MPEGFRGRQILNIDECISCGLCSRDCPAAAIEMVDVEGYEKKSLCFYWISVCFAINARESCAKKAITLLTFLKWHQF